jgi:hypothetical protein
MIYKEELITLKDWIEFLKHEVQISSTLIDICIIGLLLFITIELGVSPFIFSSENKLLIFLFVTISSFVCMYLFALAFDIYLKYRLINDLLLKIMSNKKVEGKTIHLDFIIQEYNHIIKLDTVQRMKQLRLINEN